MTNRLVAVESRKDGESERIRHALAHMSANKAYRYAVQRAGGDPDGVLLNAFRERFRRYREAWRGQPQRAIAQSLTGKLFAQSSMQPLCVDIEVAAVCDLACPFCFRQHIITPDRIISAKLFRRVVDQCAELGVPSLKLNWRGEPLLHPEIADFIDYAKRAGILEILINTNATRLDDKMGHALIEAGLDQLIFSFDGGTKQTYEKMRPGRFGANTFEEIYGNIRRFAHLKREVGAIYPRTKIQMILTEDTHHEQENFFALFNDYVDDVSVKAYTERGGAIPDLDEATRRSIVGDLDAQGISHNAAYWRDHAGNLYISKGRLACEQPYQRLMVTYDGRVSMCCYDWGSEHPVGYVDAAGFKRGAADYEKTKAQISAGKPGFSPFMADARMPKCHVDPPQVVQTLKEIWTDGPIDDVRSAHVSGKVEGVKICRRCPFKETYQWVKVGQHQPAAAE